MARTKTRRQVAEEKSELRGNLISIYREDIAYQDGDVIRFFKQYDEEGDVFTSVAIKIDTDKWYSGGAYYTWGDLLLELDRDNILEHGNLIDRATGWEEISAAPPF